MYASNRIRSIPRNAVTRVVIAVLECAARSATVYLDEKTVVTATRRFRPSKNATRVEIALKIGLPNYRNKEFIRACKKAGEPFPVKRVQLKFQVDGKKRSRK